MKKSLYEICEEARTPIDSEVSAMREAILDYCHIMAKGGYSSVILNHWMICDIFPLTKPDVSRWFNTVSEALRLIQTEDRAWVSTWRTVSSDPQEVMLKFKAKISWEHPPKEG